MNVLRVWMNPCQVFLSRPIWSLAERMKKPLSANMLKVLRTRRHSLFIPARSLYLLISSLLIDSSYDCEMMAIRKLRRTTSIRSWFMIQTTQIRLIINWPVYLPFVQNSYPGICKSPSEFLNVYMKYAKDRFMPG